MLSALNSICLPPFVCSFDDNGSPLYQKIEEVYHILSRSLRNMINNLNTDRFYLNSSKLHLNKSGDTELAKNFISFMRNF